MDIAQPCMYLPMMGRQLALDRLPAPAPAGVTSATSERVAHSQVARPRRQALQRRAQHRLGGGRVLAQVRDDLVRGHRVVLGVPAVVVGDHGQRRVADLGLAGQLGLLQVRHADDVHAPGAVQLRLGAGGELRALDADVGAAHVARWRPPPRRPRPATGESSAQNGWAKATWATSPRPKNVDSRWYVRSTNWSGITMCSGAYSP